MPTIAAILTQAVAGVIREAFAVADADPLLSPAQNEKFGDYQSNAAMGLAKRLSRSRLNPREVGQKICDSLLAANPKSDAGTPIIGQASVAGPGFVNIRLSEAFVQERLHAARADDRLAIDRSQTPALTVVDYSGPNVAKEMHVGHLRSTIIGDAIARVLEFRGDKVIRQNHVGDWGTQFGMLIAYLDEGGKSAADSLADLEAFYVAAKTHFDNDEAFADRARQTVVKLQAGSEHERRVWQQIVDQSRAHYDAIYRRLGVKLSRADERAESSYNPMLADVVRELLDKGVAVHDHGTVAVFVEGFENPLRIQKTDGGYLYGTTDLAGIKYRMQTLKADRIIYTHDSRQAQHFAQVFNAAERAGWATPDQLRYEPFGTMLGEDGKPLRTRDGGTIKLKDLLDEAEKRAAAVVAAKNTDLTGDRRDTVAKAVAIGAVKYFDLSRDRTSDYVFAWDKMLSLEGNSGPYLMYAYARVGGIFRKWAGDAPAMGTKIPLDHPAELALAKLILRLGEVIEAVVRELKPHLLCTYLYDLATRFSVFFENCPVLKADPATRDGRLALCDLTAKTIAAGLDLLGIDHPSEI